MCDTNKEVKDTIVGEVKLKRSKTRLERMGSSEFLFVCLFSVKDPTDYSKCNDLGYEKSQE